MEESKELQGFYRIFRAVIYISVLMEFFEYVLDPSLLDNWSGIGSLLYSFKLVNKNLIMTDTWCTARWQLFCSSALLV